MTTAWSGVLIAYSYSGGGYDPSDPLMTPQLISRALQVSPTIALHIPAPTGPR